MAEKNVKDLSLAVLQAIERHTAESKAPEDLLFRVVSSKGVLNSLVQLSEELTYEELIAMANSQAIVTVVKPLISDEISERAWLILRSVLSVVPVRHRRAVV